MSQPSYQRRWFRLLLKLLLLATIWLFLYRMWFYVPNWFHTIVQVSVAILLVAIPTWYAWWTDRYTFPDHCCQFCGYDSSQNPSRICPECGMNRWTGKPAEVRCPSCGHDATGFTSQCPECKEKL